MQKSKLNIPYLLIFALTLFPVQLSVCPSFTYLYVYGFSILYLTFRLSWTFNYICNRIIKFSFSSSGLIFLFLFFISVIWPMLFSTNDYTYITIYWKRFFILVLKFTYLLAIYEIEVKSINKGTEEFVQYFVVSIIMYILFSIISLVSGTVRDFAMQIIYLSKKDISDLSYDAYRTRFGWSGFSGFDHTMICSIGICFLCFYLVLNKNNIRLQMKYLIEIVLLLIGNLFYGRTGMIASIACIGITSLFLICKGNFRFVFRIIIVAIAGLMVLLYIKNYVPALEKWYRWAFSFFENAAKGKYNDSVGSFGHLVNDMYWMPEKKTLLLGDARYTEPNGRYYMRTDTGIMRHMLYYGIINYFFELIATVMIVIPLVKNINKNQKIKSGFSFFALIVFIVILGLYEFKGEALCKIYPMFLMVSSVKNDEDIFCPKKYI